MFEADVQTVTDEMEATWLREGAMYEPKEDGGREEVGKVLTTGDAVRWPPNTTKSVVLVACHFGGKDI